MPDIRTSDVHTDVSLINVAIDWGDPAFIGLQVFPKVVVDARSNKYPVYEEESFRLVPSARGQNDPAKEVDFPLSSESYYCNDYALRRFLPDQVWRNATDPGARRAIELATRVRQLKRMVLREHESQVAAALCTTDNYKAALQENLDTVANRNFDDSSGPGAIKIVGEYMDKVELECGQLPNVGIIASDAWNYLRSDSNLQGGGSTSAILTPEQIAQVLGLDRLIVARSVKSTAGKGAAASRSRLWTANSMILLYVPPGPSIDVPATGYTFCWNAFDESAEGETVRVYRDEEPGGGGEWVEYSFYNDPKRTGLDSSSDFRSAAILTNVYNAL